MESAKIVMNSEASSLMLVDESTGELNVSIPTGPVEREITGFAIPKDKGVSGWVFTNNKPYFSNDIKESEIFWKDLTNDFHTRNIICVPLQYSDGKVMGVIQVVNKKEGRSFDPDDVFVFETLAFHASSAIERAQKYEELVKKLTDREMQISEIHHRLKNNLATICALIEFDLNDIVDKNSRQMLASTSSRVKSVAEAHSLLYDKEDSETIDLSAYLNSVIHNVEKVFVDPEKDIQVKAELSKVNIDANRAMICGLILNELLINAYKHAFVDSEKGEITILLLKNDKDQIVVKVSDNGVGFSTTDIKDISLPTKIKHKGQFIVNALAKKLKADLLYNNEAGNGSSCTLSFPLNKYHG